MESYPFKVEIHGQFETYSDSSEEVKQFVESTWISDGKEKLSKLWDSQVEGLVTNVSESLVASRYTSDEGVEMIPFDAEFVFKTTLSNLGADKEQAKTSLSIILDSLQCEIDDILLVGSTVYLEEEEISS